MSRGYHDPAANAGCPTCPDFLWRLVALIHFMRLSLMKGARADLSSTAWQEIGVKPDLSASACRELSGYHSTQIIQQLAAKDACP